MTSDSYLAIMMLPLIGTFRVRKKSVYADLSSLGVRICQKTKKNMSLWFPTFWPFLSDRELTNSPWNNKHK